MQTVIKKNSARRVADSDPVVSTKKKRRLSGYSNSYDPMGIRKKTRQQTQPDTAFYLRTIRAPLQRVYIFQVDGGGASRLAHCLLTMHLK
jgi:hypothetical protein